MKNPATAGFEDERDLREYAIALEGSKDLIAAVDSQYRYRMVNQTFLTRHNLNREQVIGRCAEEILGKELFHQQIKPHVDRCLRGEEVNYEIEVEYPKIGVRHLEVNYFPFRANGVVNRVVTIIRDVTERVRAAAALRKAYEQLEAEVQERTAALNQALLAAESAIKAKDEFLKNMGHELRTPLNHIIGFTELVLDESVGPLNHSQKDFLSDVHQSAGNLKFLLNDIIELSNIESGHVEFAPSPVDLRELLATTLTAVQESSAVTRPGLSISIETIPVTIWADKLKLHKVIYCLLANAVKFSPDGGNVRVVAKLKAKTAAQPSEHVQITVADEGVGIEPGNLARIFDSFEQGDYSANKSYQGQGVGLSLAKHYVSLHGGSIWAESAGPGRGSVFCFTLPLR